MRPAGEPTVEEILESIKKVIARDNRTVAAGVRRQRESDGIAEEAPLVRNDAQEDEGSILNLSASEEYLPEDLDEASDEAPLLAESTRAGMRDSFAALAMLAEPGAQPQIVRSGETSLEDMVRELLRPALAAWLDKNLPPIVEQMVADEIRRISSKKG